MLPPASRIGPIAPAERAAVMAGSAVAGVYDTPVDRESAYEKLKSRAQVSTAAAQPAAAGAPAANGGIGGAIRDSIGGLWTGSGRKDSLIEAMAKSAARTMGSTVGREIIRGVLGSLMGKRR